MNSTSLLGRLGGLGDKVGVDAGGRRLRLSAQGKLAKGIGR